MNDKSVEHLSYIFQCNPEDAQLRHEYNVQTIVRSPDYAKLKSRPEFARYFEQLFGVEKIQSFTDTELDNVLRVLPIIPDVLDEMVCSIQCGGGPKLDSKDTPDFMDEASLKHVKEKLKDASGKNYSNIKSPDFMELFSDNTVKSIEGDFGKLPDGCSDYDKAISEIYKGKRYCISSAEIQKLEAEFQAQVNEVVDVINSERKKRRLYRVFKVAVGICCVLIPTIYSGLTGNLSDIAAGICTIGELALVIAFCIGG